MKRHLLTRPRAAVLELCEAGWANESRTDGVTTTWRISITNAEAYEVNDVLETPLVVPVTGHYLVTHDEGGEVGVERFATPEALLHIWNLA